MTMPLAEVRSLQDVLTDWSKELQQIATQRAYLTPEDVGSQLANVRMDARVEVSALPKCLQLLAESVRNRMNGDNIEFKVNSLIATVQEAIKKSR